MKRFLTAVVTLALLLAAAPARGDTLRNIEPGQPVPKFSLRTLSGETISGEQRRGRVVALVYLSAEQQSSEDAMRMAAAVGRTLRSDGLDVIFVTADATRVGYFRQLRDRLKIHEFPLAIDAGRGLYGDLGLIVLPTTIVIDREGRLAHVIASCRSDYQPMLTAYAWHALGLMDDAELERQLTARSFRRDRPEDRIARHRATARLLRQKGLPSEAENELRTALEIDANHADALLDLASLHIEQGRLDDATVLVEEVMAAEPHQRRGKLFTGVLLYYRGRMDEADRALQEALLLNPDPVWTHYYLGLVKERQGDEAAAIQHLKEALGRLLEEQPM